MSSKLDVNKLPLPQQFEYVSRCSGLAAMSREELEEQIRFWMFYYYVQTEKVKDLTVEKLGLSDIREQHKKDNMTS